MKIVIATPLYPPEIGGPATDAAALAEYFSTHGGEVHVCAFRDTQRFPKGIRHLIYSYRVFRASRGASGVVAFDTVSVGVPALFAATLARLPLIVRVPGDYAWEQGRQRFHVQESIEDFQTRRYGLSVECLRALQRLTVRHAALVIAPSIYFKRIVSTWGVSPAKLVHLYLGLDPVREVQPHEREGRIIVSVGRLVPWKGFPLVLELVAQFPEWQAVIIGDGPLRQSLQARAAALGVTDRVQFMGPLGRRDVLAWCARADAFVLNTAFESFSFQILEAMQVGAPILTTRIGSIPELIDDGVEGVLSTPNDFEAFVRALESVEADPALWQKRREAAKRKAAAFSLETSARAFTELLRSVCA